MIRLCPAYAKAARRFAALPLRLVMQERAALAWAADQSARAALARPRRFLFL
jgi:hypothetical protein